MTYITNMYMFLLQIFTFQFPMEIPNSYNTLVFYFEDFFSRR